MLRHAQLLAKMVLNPLGMAALAGVVATSGIGPSRHFTAMR
jgi:hypothetical protein